MPSYLQNDHGMTRTEYPLPTAAELRDRMTRSEAFDRLVRTMLQPVYWHIRRLVVLHDDAQDATQNAFVKTFEHIESFRGGDGELRAWIYRIATNEALDTLRHRRRSIFSSIDDVSRELAGKVAAESTEDADRALVEFQQAALALPLKQRLVFNLRYYDELSYEQIAEITGSSVQTLKTNYHYAVEKLKKHIKATQL